MAKRTASAKKQARAGARRTVRNRSTKSEVKTLITKARVALRGSGSGSSEVSDVREATVEAIRALDRAAAKRTLHRNNAARRKSRLARRLAKVAAPPAPAPAQAAGKGKKSASQPAAPAAPAATAAKKK